MLLQVLCVLCLCEDPKSSGRVCSRRITVMHPRLISSWLDLIEKACQRWSSPVLTGSERYQQSMRGTSTCSDEDLHRVTCSPTVTWGASKTNVLLWYLSILCTVWVSITSLIYFHFTLHPNIHWFATHQLSNIMLMCILFAHKCRRTPYPWVRIPHAKELYQTSSQQSRKYNSRKRRAVVYHALMQGILLGQTKHFNKKQKRQTQSKDLFSISSCCYSLFRCFKCAYAPCMYENNAG